MEKFNRIFEDSANFKSWVAKVSSTPKRRITPIKIVENINILCNNNVNQFNFMKCCSNVRKINK